MTARYTILSVLLLSGAAALTGCAHHPRVIADVPPPPPVPIAIAAAPTLPAGMSPTAVVPYALPDGTFPTPNRDLTPTATLWHFRVALNVAALACRGAQGDAITAAYNAMLTRRRVYLAAAETRFAAEWRTGGGDWRDRYDDAMTRLYNYFSLSPARDAFCAAASQVIAESQGVPDDALPQFAATQLPVLDRPFTDVFRAFDAWRAANQPARAPSQTVYALAAAPRTAPPTVHPRLELDPSVFQMP